MNPEVLSIKSHDKLNLTGLYIKNKKEKGLIILSHGYRSNVRRDLYASTHEYYDMGYSLLLINSRGCESEGKYITFGYQESRDISSWVNYMHKKKPKLKIILGGISLGATSTLMVNNKYVSLMIVDSGYKNAYEEISYVIKHYFHLPAFIFMPMISFYTYLFMEFRLKDVNTFNNLSKIDIPILFIHGYEDDFVLPQNTIDNYNHYKHKKDILIISGATHGMGYLVDRNSYINKIKEFIKKNI